MNTVKYDYQWYEIKWINGTRTINAGKSLILQFIPHSA